MKLRVCLTDFLDEEQIEEVFRLKRVDWIREMVIEPNLEAISQKLGHPQDAFFLAYLCEYAVNAINQKKKPKRHSH